MKKSITTKQEIINKLRDNNIIAKVEMRKNTIHLKDWNDLQAARLLYPYMAYCSGFKF